MSKKRLYLLDGMALAYRAHFAFIRSNLKNSEGIPTGPVLGFANTLLKLLDEEKPTHVSVVWDTHEPTFRHEIDDSYKANRPPQPEELKTGIPLIKEMVGLFGITNLEKDGYEADDIIGTLASRAKQEDVDVFLVTPDKDFMQLVQDHVTMIKPDNQNGGFQVIDPEGVKEYFGVYPDQVIDVLALIGDTSDNIPGVPGIGKKGAPKLIQKFGSLEKALEEAPNVKAKRAREGLMNYSDQALHAKKMVMIKTDVPETISWEELTWKGANKEKIGRFFKRMEFRTLTKRYLGEEPGGQSDLFSGEDSSAATSETSEPLFDQYEEDAVTYRTLTTESEIKQLLSRLDEYKEICFDTETDSSDPMSATPVGLSFAVSPKEAWYLPMGVQDALPVEQVCELVQPLFAQSEITLIAHNFKYDYIVLRRSGVEISGNVFDTMVAAFLLDASQRLKMDDLAKRYLNYEPVSIEELIGKGKSQKSMDQLHWKEVAAYACEDADITYRLFQLLSEKLKEDELLQIAEQVEFPLVTVLAEMEMYGVRIDREMLESFSQSLLVEMKKTESRIYEEAGTEFNLNSPQQLGEVLFEKLKLPAGKKTRTGQYSTAESVLTDLANKYPVAGWILDYRSLSKLKSTYADALPRLIHEETGRIHTSFNQTVASTGRLSSSNPNLQNIPVRTEMGREIRKAFVPEEGFQMLAADYSQVELRVIASISKDKQMLQAFKEGEDIHSRTAMEVFSLSSIEEVTPDHRRKAKEVNFGIPYGVSAYGLASRLGISNSEGKEMIDRYFERFLGVKEYIEESKEFAREHGYVKTLMGRRRYIPDIASRNWNVRGFAERIAINMPVQGTAADIIKIAMIRIQDWLQDHSYRTRMLLQVHDELVFELHEKELDLAEPIREMMESAVELDVPLKVDMGIADNWLKAH
ncbi:MAG: DNA polymerase I [Balneolaceae bacterium]